MKVQRILSPQTNDVTFALLNDEDQPIEIVPRFMRHLHARDSSPNTLSASCFDLLHFMVFLKDQQLTYEQFTPAHAWALLEYLRGLPSRLHAQRLGPVLCTTEQGRPATRLSPATIHRILATVSSFYEYLIVTDLLLGRENLLQKVDDPALARVSERHRPLMGHAWRQRPIRRAVRVKTGKPGATSHERGTDGATTKITAPLARQSHDSADAPGGIATGRGSLPSTR
jgi:hypothetical protein